MSSFIQGMKVKYLPQPEWGVGHLVSVEEGGARAVVQFPGRENGQALTVSTRGGVLQHAVLEPGRRSRPSRASWGWWCGKRRALAGSSAMR